MNFDAKIGGKLSRNVTGMLRFCYDYAKKPRNVKKIGLVNVKSPANFTNVGRSLFIIYLHYLDRENTENHRGCDDKKV